MAEKSKPGALLRRVAPSVPLELTVPPDASGNLTTKSFRLCFDMNAAAAVEERTATKDTPGLRLTDVRIWAQAGPRLIRVLLWAAVLAHHPEYNTADDEGLEVIGSYMDDSNTDAVLEAVWAAYLAWLPADKREIVERLRKGEPDQNPQVPPEKATPAAEESGTGSSSGQSPDTTSDSPTQSSDAST